ncbi:hypothetical protein [Demequina globuliformis]|uniref:hypothetical protein n=1 Tax=Demequina globuliformis TaxID=676202 RepID=UPI00128E5B1A|nr:hypothetical protein [Demequina globuliformis]
MRDVNRMLWDALKIEATGQRLADLLLPAPEIYLRRDKDDVVSTLDVFESWLHYASLLLSRSDFYLHGVYNKTKHGLAVAARDDMRLAITTAAPTPEGSIRLSDINGPKTTDVIRAPVIEALHRSPGRRKDNPGLEVSQVQIDIDEVLQECEMVAWVHGALFHGLAREHFESRGDQVDGLTAPPHPGLYPDGPTPRTDDFGLPTGFRDRITLGGQSLPERKTGIAFPGRFVGLNQHGPMQTGQVVDG